MSKALKLLLLVIASISGFFLMAWAYGTPLGHPISTVAFLLGFGLIIGGPVCFLIFLLRK